MSSTPPTGMTSLTLVSLGSWWAALDGTPSPDLTGRSALGLD